MHLQNAKDLIKRDPNFSITDNMVDFASKLEIQIQANKVALEVAHLQELLNHWGNAPCTVARVPPDILAYHTLPRGRRQGRSSFACRSHMPRSQASRHYSPSGGDGGWRRHSASPPRRGFGWSSGLVAPPPSAPCVVFGKWPFHLELAISPPPS